MPQPPPAWPLPAVRAAPAPRLCQNGVPRLVARPWPLHRAPLHPLPCAGAMGGRDPPCGHPASLLAGPAAGSGHCSAAPGLRPGFMDLLPPVRGRVGGCGGGEKGAERWARWAPGPVPAWLGPPGVQGGVWGSGARLRALSLTAALGAAGVVPPGGAGAGGRRALLALAVRLPRLQRGRKRG